ncbi:ubiquitin-40S ribosomal protein S27a (macronuclear) [Tetrahymena thermophila SB210]|uniref:Ubiquitin-40S ribosomal protein S27a n=2 Tax=Tetrahymena thermophila TaxID=5911 RepID=I7MMJ4_TETTS|nr:ubiquitin-40S ribosomal protein S27a [Tetrahymena thermophila SB210]4BPN_9 Chain 9, 40s Ribosomal Protein Rps31e [Tetrahymena thermophila]4BPO_9 Chain 9, 40s Ribosomal Protein Rps31e [Tetrahymena thermophila]4BTS_A9 Chain A9, 40S RIBOSOMAL PROTEIN RPS31E [Tetrahymena thermophila]4BTS_B9 Chain B9, 40S RIBOSOMAL PROTEIN RPS31E [Tetrahymena thermophila]4BTS_C9 Chain C9, 40S RIBOSOMAL PROTEIN RPS31E [Tetrahymena thermophila]4BTS_D9 Chain D9, 40S RIBOSOMAL PROTEIN RPS31E [Tetrahymena thermophil|eukprot:XP_001025217.1 ubiquitin-40S ribosomal protein S27a [Tetrahymena thermophila SB210]
MQVQVKTLEGETKIYTLEQGTSVLDLKSQISQDMGFEIDMMTLVNNGFIAPNTELVTDDVTYYLSLKLLGGKKKKKKKSYTTKKKTKHRHVHTKLGALAFYKLENNGKVSLQQKGCPKCGPGIFMAKHYDRHYCGKCHLTLKIDAETAKKNLEELKKKQDAKKSGAAATDAGAGGAGKKDAKKGKKGKK